MPTDGRWHRGNHLPAGSVNFGRVALMLGSLVIAALCLIALKVKPEEQRVVVVGSSMLRDAERLIESCEACNRDGAEIPFDNILDRITSSDPSVTAYILEEPAECPDFRRAVLEKTLVEPC
jgi:hypothetical protein